jgi:hypothetical protein
MSRDIKQMLAVIYESSEGGRNGEEMTSESSVWLTKPGRTAPTGIGGL